jgi:hypothetical protein
MNRRLSGVLEYNLRYTRSPGIEGVGWMSVPLVLMATGCDDAQMSERARPEQSVAEWIEGDT